MSEQRRTPGPVISSTANEQIQFVKTLYRTAVRRRERLYVVEGVRLVEEALLAEQRPELVLVAPDQLAATPRGQALLERLQGFPTVKVSDNILKSVSDTVTPQGVIAVLPIPSPPKHPRLGPLALILDRIRDPGNAGTLLRSADASGLTQTVAFVDSVDAYAPKVVRSAMGAHFRLTILNDVNWAALQPLLDRRPIYLAAADGGLPYDEVNWTEDAALIIGGEAEGAGPAAESLASQRITIPMGGPVESLNAAMAGTIILFEAAAQRRRAQPGAERAPGRPPGAPRPRPPTAHQPGPRPPARPYPGAPRPAAAGGGPGNRWPGPRNATDHFAEPPRREGPWGEQRRGPKQPFGKPMGEPSGRPPNKPFGKPPGKPLPERSGKPFGERRGKPFEERTGKPVGERRGKPFGKPGPKAQSERPPRRSGGKPHRPKL